MKYKIHQGLKDKFTGDPSTWRALLDEDGNHEYLLVSAQPVVGTVTITFWEDDVEDIVLENVELILLIDSFSSVIMNMEITEGESKIDTISVKVGKTIYKYVASCNYMTIYPITGDGRWS